MFRFRDFGVFVFDLGVFVFEFWVLRFPVLGASFSRVGCFVLRSSFSSASFSKLPLQSRGAHDNENIVPNHLSISLLNLF